MLGEGIGPCDVSSPLDERPRILVVDDELDVAHTVSSILRQEQYEVATALSAGEALCAMIECPYDVLLIELGLAEADGLSLLTEVRQRAPTTCCIVLTGYASLESAVAALRRGVYDYLVKPCVIEDLKQTVSRAVAQRRLSLLAVQRERQLKELNDELEKRVQARTVELTQANQRLAEASESKDRFLATLSHELRTPLTPLRAGLDLLRSRLPGGEWLLILDAMERNLIQETRLIDDLLDIARITAGELSVEKRPVDLADCLRASLEMAEPRAFLKGQRLRVDLHGPFPVLLADPLRLQQLVTNLLDNAVKFSPLESQILLSAWLSEGQVFLEVVDRGPGIDPASLPRVFEPFWQADSSSRRQHGGTGLGLAIARQIAILHGGELRAANSSPGPGARFTLRLPLLPAEGSSQRAATPRPPNSRRVLLVDDSLDTIQVLGWLLTAKGLRVREAVCVQQAIEAARAETPDVIITDIGMPVQNGYDLLRLLRADKHLCHIPVVAATGYVGSREQEQMAEAGFAASLSKPFDLAELLTTLERVCPASAPMIN
jgi:signal transduction histidine kinase